MIWKIFLRLTLLRDRAACDPNESHIKEEQDGEATYAASIFVRTPVSSAPHPRSCNLRFPRPFVPVADREGLPAENSVLYCIASLSPILGPWQDAGFLREHSRSRVQLRALPHSIIPQSSRRPVSVFGVAGLLFAITHSFLQGPPRALVISCCFCWYLTRSIIP